MDLAALVVLLRGQFLGGEVKDLFAVLALLDVWLAAGWHVSLVDYVKGVVYLRHGAQEYIGGHSERWVTVAPR